MKSFIDFLNEKTQQLSLPYEEAQKAKEARESWQAEYDRHADRGGMSHEQIIKKIGAEPVNEARKIRVFDFDDTLAKTDSGVIVRHKKTGNTRKLSSGEYAKFGPDDEEELDFSEFNKVKNAKPLKPADTIAREVSRKKKEVVILTARQPKSAKSIRKYLKGRGIAGKHLKIIAVGSSDPNAKRTALKAHLTGKKKITHVDFMDDHRANVEAVGELKKEFPKIKFRLRVAKQHK